MRYILQVQDKREMEMKYWTENLQGEDYLEGLNENGTITL
jgi:hypothetical protein